MEQDNEMEYHYIDELETIDDLFAMDDENAKVDIDTNHIENGGLKELEDNSIEEEPTTNEEDDSTVNHSLLDLFAEEDLEVNEGQEADGKPEAKEEALAESVLLEEVSKATEVESTEQVEFETIAQLVNEEMANIDKIAEDTNVATEHLEDILNDFVVEEKEEDEELVELTELDEPQAAFGMEEDEDTSIKDLNDEIELLDLTLSSEVESDEEENYEENDLEPLLEAEDTTEATVERSIEDLPELKELHATEKEIQPEETEEQSKAKDNDFEEFTNKTEEETSEEESFVLDDLSVQNAYADLEGKLNLPENDKKSHFLAGGDRSDDENVEDELLFKGIHSLHKKNHGSMEDLIAELKEHNEENDQSPELNQEVFLAPLEDDEEDLEKEKLHLEQTKYRGGNNERNALLPRLRKYKKKKWWKVWK
jgi:hypothetical protein